MQRPTFRSHLSFLVCFLRLGVVGKQLLLPLVFACRHHGASHRADGYHGGIDGSRLNVRVVFVRTLYALNA